MARIMSSASRAGFLANLEVRTKIFAGFGCMLVLIAAMAGLAWTSSERAQSGLLAYAGQSRIAASSFAADTALLQAQLAASRYLSLGEMEDVGSFNARQDEVRQHLAEIRQLMTTEAGVQAVDEILTLQADYGAAFERLVSLRQQRDDLVRTILNETGAELRELITSIRDAEAGERNFDSLKVAASLNGNFLVARTVAARFVEGHADADRQEVQDVLLETRKGLQTLRTVSTAAGNEERLSRAQDLLDAYEAGFQELADTIVEMDGVVSGSFTQVGPMIAALSSWIRDDATMQQRLSEEAALADGLQVRSLILTLSALALAGGLLVAWLINRAITRPVVAMTAAMGRLAEGDETVDIPARGRRDEIGRMAEAVQVFKENLVRTRQMEEAAKLAEERAELERRQALETMADRFEGSVGAVVTAVSQAAEEMQHSARTLTATADRTKEQAMSVASAADQASNNANTVAAATEELSSSITEISRQVQQSTEIAASAVEEAGRTNTLMASLSVAAQQIGEVVGLITAIAEQTNLLALNATIEAARAGEAGKGFAVVASEVKNLATQTTRATEDIAAKVEEIRNATEGSAKAMDSISRTIETMNGIVASIAAAIEEQGAATREIAGNVSQAAAGTRQVSATIAEVNRAAGETGTAAEHVLDAAGELGRQAEVLRREVETFLATVRVA